MLKGRIPELEESFLNYLIIRYLAVNKERCYQPNTKIKMVKEILKSRKKYFQCNDCKLFYKSRNIAEECENWCKEHKSCNLEIIKSAVKV